MGSSLCAKLRDLIPLLRERAVSAEEARQLPPETIHDLRDAGMIRALVPRRAGGDERPLWDVLEGVIELARGCSSTSWVGSLAALHNWAIALFDERAQHEVWADGPDSFIVSSVAPSGSLTKVDGGFVLDGRWSFVSGASYGSWALVGGKCKELAEQPPPDAKPWETGPPPDFFFLLVPMTAARIDDDWHVSGLKATGSNSISLERVFVPEHRALSLRDVFRGRAPGLAVHPEALYRAPFRCVFDSAFPPVALGTALANVDAFRDHTAGRVHAYSGAAFRASQGHLQCLADAKTQLHAALALFRHNVEKVAHAEGISEAMRGSMETQIGYEHAYVIDRCSYAIARLFRASGGKALYTHNPLQRYFRDVHAITQHAMADLESVGSRYGAMMVDQAVAQPASARAPTDRWLPIR